MALTHRNPNFTSVAQVTAKRTVSKTQRSSRLAGLLLATAATVTTSLSASIQPAAASSLAFDGSKNGAATLVLKELKETFLPDSDGDSFEPQSNVTTRYFNRKF